MDNQKIKLVIFDLDGTSADTIEGITEGLNRTMHALGYPTHTTDSVRGFVNYGVRRFIEEALPAPACNDPDEVTHVMEVYGRQYAETYTMTVSFQGMAELLDRLSERCLVAVNSNKQDEFVKELTTRLFRPGLFMAAEGFRDDRPGKPDPAMAYAIMQKASAILHEPVFPAECIYVGDSDIDYMTALNAGMIPVSVSWGYRDYAFLRALGDQKIAQNVDELWDILVQMGV